MASAPLPYNESERLKALKQLRILDTPIEERFERITRLVAHALNVPKVAFTLIDRDRQWLKSEVGLNGVTETTRDVAFCAHTILGDDILHVPDATLDDRFSDNPLVTDGLKIRFYAGCPVRSPEGQRVGSLCAIDTEPRQLNDRELQTLRDLTLLLETELRAVQLSSAQSELLAELNEAQTLALIDTLTRVWNRRGIYELLKRRWSEATRNEQLVVLAVADIDHFKSVNDTQGHAAGDVVLQAVARRILAALREGDAVGRVGGEEFLILLTGCAAEEMKRTVERIRHAIADSPIPIPGGALKVTMSIGVAASTPDGTHGYEDLVNYADKALHVAKREGRNRVHLADSPTIRAVVQHA